MNRFLLFIAASTALTASVLPAAPASGTEAPPRLVDEMVVTAGRIPEPKRAIPANVTVIDEAAILQSTAVDLGELLAQNGLDVRQYPGSLTTIAIRGFRTDSHGNDLKGQVLILFNEAYEYMDGYPMPERNFYLGVRYTY